MKHTWKHGALCMLALMLCLAAVMGAQAAETQKGATAVACEVSQADIWNGISMAAVGDTLYRLMMDGEVYAWEPAQGRYALYTQAPASPWYDLELPLEKQSPDVRDGLMEAVQQLIPAQNGLYGLNLLSGSFGPIDAAGWHVGDVRLDTSPLMRSDLNSGYPHALRNAYIENGSLYAFHDLSLYSDAPPQSRLIIFDLSGGSCDVTDLPNTLSICRYAPGKLLCLQDDGTETPSLAVYDMASRAFTRVALDLPVSIPRATFARSFYLHRMLDGLAYDAARDAIYFETPKQLWRSVAGEPFAPVATGDTDFYSHIPFMEDGYMSAPDEAHILSFGGYVSQSTFPFCVMP